MMKAQKVNATQHTPNKVVNRLQTQPTAIQEVVKTQGSSSKGVVRPPSSPIPPNAETAQVEVEDLDQKTNKPRDPNGHKVKTCTEIITSSHKTKYLPLADGMNTGDVYFQPCAIHAVNKNWIDCEMVEYLFGAGIMSLHYVFSIDADDLLRMIYLKDMFCYDLDGESRVSFEEWLVNVFSEIVKEDAQADFSDHGMIANFIMSKETFNWNISSSPYVQVIFQKRCIHDFKDPQPDIVLHGENPNVVKCKALRGKFEYVIEGRIFTIHTGEGLGALPVPERQDPNADLC